MTYARYLALDELLAAQQPRSDCDDEMLFVIVHQTKELWLKQMIRELRLAKRQVRADALVEAYKALARVSRIQAVMTLSWDVLATMTPSDYIALPRRARAAARASSRTSSARSNTCSGLKAAAACTRRRSTSGDAAALAEPSLWDDANRRARPRRASRSPMRC